ncbi:hypothetical protein DFH09DRAFT_1083429 [Mycena vulgaris]|nr:hypothetical protein DFH09DRAFT_1083429 [Mycena vulgaris]
MRTGNNLKPELLTGVVGIFAFQSELAQSQNFPDAMMELKRLTGEPLDMTAGSWSQAVRYVPEDDSTMLEFAYINRGRNRCKRMNAYFHVPAVIGVDCLTGMRIHNEEGVERLVSWDRRASEGVPAPGWECADMLVRHAGGDGEALDGCEIVALGRRKVEPILLLEVEDSIDSRRNRGSGDIG